MKFKVGDKVKFVGAPDWTGRILNYIGEEGVVYDINLKYYMSTNNSAVRLNKSGKAFLIEYNHGIELVDNQLVFDFMKE